MRDYRSKDEMQQQIDDLKYLLRTTANAVEQLANLLSQVNTTTQQDFTEANAIAARVHEAHMKHHKFRSDLMETRQKRAKRYLNEVADMCGEPRLFPQEEHPRADWDKKQPD